jgi:hypothetical protein
MTRALVANKEHRAVLGLVAGFGLLWWRMWW